MDRRGCAATYISPVCSLMERVWGTQITLEYLKSGIFEWSMPFGSVVRHKEAEKPGCDWIGINFYGRC